MQKQIVTLSEKKLVGIKVRTSYQNEINPTLAKISPCVQEYFYTNVPALIQNRLFPGTTYCAYTEYEDEYHGGYTYFIGEEVSTYDDLPGGHETLTIPAQTYVKYIVGPGTMPALIIDAWTQIWKTTEEELGGKRNFITDFEVYDERASNPDSTILDIYVGIME